MMESSQRERRLEGIKMSNGGPEISHLLFDDDSLFLIKADQWNSKELFQIFTDCEKASG